MIFRRLLLAATALATFSAGAAVFVVAVAFALYALAEPRLGRAGAAAAATAAAAGLIVILGFFVAWMGRRKRPKTLLGLSGGALKRAFEFVKQNPIVAASAAIGAGVMAVRNPKYLGEVLRAFLDGQSSSK